MDGPLVRYGLTDWKFTLPAGLALAVPFLANEVSLMLSFASFPPSIYKI